MGKSADGFRYYFAGTTLEKLSELYLNYYAERNPRIEKSGLPEIKDQEAENVIVVSEKYSIPDFWKDSKHYIRADRILDEIGKPQVSRRLLPLAVRYPVNVMQWIEVETPGNGYESEDTQSFKDNAVDFKYKRTREGKVLVLAYYFKTLRDHVPVNEVQQHLATLDNIWHYTGYNLPLQPARDELSPAATLMTVVLLVGLTASGVFLYRRVVRRRPLHKVAFNPGGDPSSPIPARDNQQMLKHLDSMSCRCGLRFDLKRQPLREETILFDGERITVFRGSCARCGSEQDVYFKGAALSG